LLFKSQNTIGSLPVAKSAPTAAKIGIKFRIFLVLISKLNRANGTQTQIMAKTNKTISRIDIKIIQGFMNNGLFFHLSKFHGIKSILFGRYINVLFLLLPYEVQLKEGSMKSIELTEVELLQQ